MRLEPLISRFAICTPKCRFAYDIIQNAEVAAMLIYVLGGAVVGAMIGYLVPPGTLFWFLVGAVSGFAFQRYLSQRF